MSSNLSKGAIELVKIVFTLILVLIIFSVFIRLFENSFIYFPAKYPDGFWQTETFGLKVEDCYFTTADGVRLHGWLLTNENAVATLLWCHGNAGNIAGRLDNLAKLKALPVNVFLFDYRGYGKSEGQPNEKGVYRDAVAAYDYLVSRPNIDPDTIIPFGRSLGGAVAVDLATKRACAGLILESTFTTAKDMAKSAFGPIPVHWFIKTEFNSIEKIGQIRVPLLVLHGTEDTTVPFKLGRQLFEAANNPKEFYEIQGADHNNTYFRGGKDYFHKFEKFITRAVR
ncbi:alpha/beta hydrolase [candidate division KSB1 bacterium]|nr:alpha/beta hydrolase [candidate division KSB1 bacterium]NIR70344.1 alpha/beta hydrolase [candidate division KSB1 bacterium]NIS23114.1 alpha/beta hydrolase [candidate division KSB1 bacterium]NIT69949.1 alpha/beta hydrolase [candidate division KSB1 bacterium]NIU23606.1 alpha/beta hydrolase [candidate division KSB1 bacterium]